MKKIYLKRCKGIHPYDSCKICQGIVIENYLDGTLTINKAKARKVLYIIILILSILLWIKS